MTFCASNPSCAALFASANQDEKNCIIPVAAFAIPRCKIREPRICRALLNQSLAVGSALLTGSLARLVTLLTGIMARLLAALLPRFLSRILGLLAGLLVWLLVALLSLLRLTIVLLIRHIV